MYHPVFILLFIFSSICLSIFAIDIYRRLKLSTRSKKLGSLSTKQTIYTQLQDK